MQCFYCYFKGHMTRILVQVRQTPTILPGVPLPLKTRGRQPKPINPVFAQMKPGEAIVVTGKSEVNALRNDLTRYLKSLGPTVARFVTRNLSGAPANNPDNPDVTLRNGLPHVWPEDTMGLWCLTVHAVPALVDQFDGPDSPQSVSELPVAKFSVGDRVCFFDSPKTFKHSWEVMGEFKGRLNLGGPGYLESMSIALPTEVVLFSGTDDEIPF